MYKARGKVFMLMTQVRVEPLVILKSAGGNTIDETLGKEFVTDSYRLVVSGLAKSQQPVDPHTCGRRA